MSRFPWFPFQAANWRNVSEMLTEVERGVCIELYAVYWNDQPIESLALTAEEWARRLRLSQLAAPSILAVLRKLAGHRLLTVNEMDGCIVVEIPFLSDEYSERAKDSERHRRNPPTTGSGTFRATSAERSGGQDKTGQDKQREEGPAANESSDAHPESPPSARASDAAPPPDLRTKSIEIDQPEPPETLRAFERWWRLDVVPVPQRNEQRKFVAQWNKLIEEEQIAFPGLDVMAGIREFYGFDGGRKKGPYTPRSRREALHQSLSRLQDRSDDTRRSGFGRAPASSRTTTTPGGTSEYVNG